MIVAISGGLHVVADEAEAIALATSLGGALSGFYLPTDQVAVVTAQEVLDLTSTDPAVRDPAIAALLTKATGGA